MLIRLTTPHPPAQQTDTQRTNWVTVLGNLDPTEKTEFFLMKEPDIAEIPYNIFSVSL